MKVVGYPPPYGGRVGVVVGVSPPPNGGPVGLVVGVLIGVVVGVVVNVVIGEVFEDPPPLGGEVTVVIGVEVVEVFDCTLSAADCRIVCPKTSAIPGLMRVGKAATDQNNCRFLCCLTVAERSLAATHPHCYHQNSYSG